MYATPFPDRVRQMVIDAPVDTDLWQADALEFLGEVATASETTLDAWFETCRTEGVQACPFGGGDPEAAFDALITRLEAQPLQDGVDGAVALEVARAAAGDRATWPFLTATLLAAERGDGSLLDVLWTALTVSPFPVPTAVQEQHVAVRCADWNTPTDVAAHTVAAEDVVADNERIGTRAAYSALDCAVWPAPNEDRVTEPLTGAGARRSWSSAAAWIRSPRTTGPSPWPTRPWTRRSCSPARASDTAPTAPSPASMPRWTPR
jgi:hypothetical protein